MRLLTVAELEARLPPKSLPLSQTEEGGLDEERINLALEEATGVIVAHLPWLLAEASEESDASEASLGVSSPAGELIEPLPARFADAIRGICVDLARSRLDDSVTSSQDAREMVAQKIKLLETLSREYQGGLAGPEYQGAQLVEGGGVEGAHDVRFFRKGEI